MATISISVTAGANTTSRTRTISSADLIRFIAAYRALFNTPSAVDQDVVLQWMDTVFSGAKTVVRSYENQQAQNAAVAAQTDIGLL